MINQNRLQLPKIQYLLTNRKMPAFSPSYPSPSRYWDNPYETSPLHIEMTRRTRRSSQSSTKMRAKGKDRPPSQQKEAKQQVKVLDMMIRKFRQEERKCPSPSPTYFVQNDKENQQEVFVKRARQVLNRKNVHSRMTEYSQQLSRRQFQSILSQKNTNQEQALSGWNNSEEEFFMMI